MPKRSSKLPESIHFSLEQVAEGIFAAISAEEGGAMGNAGIVDLGDQTIVFDTFETPAAAEDLRVASKKLTGRSATWVVNSHSHPDHWFGNQVFPPETIIITSHLSAELMTEYFDAVAEEKSDPSELENYLQDLISQITQEQDHNKKGVLKSALARWTYYLESLHSLNLRIPNQAFTGKISLHGSNRSVDLIDVGSAHTSADCYLSIPAENIAFLGDIGFFEQLPYMADCDPEGWISILEDLKRSALKILIPGHGPVGDVRDIVKLEDYIVLLNSLVEDAINDGKSVDEVINYELPEPYKTWTIGSQRMEINTKTMFEYLSRRSVE